MTSSQDDSMHSDLQREGPGNQPGGIPERSIESDVSREGPGIKPGGIPGASVQCNKKGKRKLTNYTVEMKYRAIMAVEEGKTTKTKVAADFGVPQNTLSTWLKKAAEIKQSYTSGDLGPQRKKCRQAKFPEVEEAVLTWFKNARNENVSISGPFLAHKANSFARELGLSESEFCCSNGWLERFKERHGIVFKKVCGEAKSVDTSSDKMVEWNARLRAILSEHSPENVFNADETGLFYRALSDKTLEFKNIDCHGGKQSKERLTVMVCANMTGTEKVKMLVIGKSAKPRCFKNVKSLPTDYEANKKAWMVAQLFTEWLLKFDRKMNAQQRKVALIVDNCPAHPHVKGLKAVKLVFLPPNSTSITQPMDQGVIKSLKVQYRNLVMQRQSNCVDQKVEFKLTVLDALRLLQQAWTKVTPSCISNCFRKANFVPVANAEDILEEEDPDDDIPLAHLITGGVSLADYAAIDENVPISGTVTDKAIISDIISARNQQHSEPEDEEDDNTALPSQQESRPPTIATAYSSMDTFRSFVESHENVPDNVLSAIATMGNYISRIQKSGQNTKQKSITDYLAPHVDRTGS